MNLLQYTVMAGIHSLHLAFYTFFPQCSLVMLLKNLFVGSLVFVLFFLL